MILTEGGQLVIHDLQHWQPTPLTLPVQELPPMTLARLVPTVSLAVLKESTAGGSAAVSPRPSSSGLPSPSPRGSEAPSAGAVALHTQQQQQGPLPQHALTLDRVRACSRRGGALGEGGGNGLAPPPLEHWPFTGGQPAASLAGSGNAAAAASVRRHPSALYFSGHRDGRVRVWDATTQVPELLLTIPAVAGQERLRAVTAMEVGHLEQAGLLPAAGVLKLQRALATNSSSLPCSCQLYSVGQTNFCCIPPGSLSCALRAGGPILRDCDGGPRRRRCQSVPVLRLAAKRAPHEYR